jgi:hypothetical protein
VQLEQLSGQFEGARDLLVRHAPVQ